MNNKSPKVCITTITNKGYKYLPNIINNYIRQIYPYKKLIIIFNSDDVKKDEINDKLYSNGITDSIIEIIPNKSLGQCLNYSIQQIPEQYDIWCKMDDDDFYGKNYVMTNLESMLRTNADIIGRRDMYVYVPGINKLYFKKNGGHNIFVEWVQGASLFVKKNVFKKVIFPDKNKGEDTHFQLIAKKKGFKIFASYVNDFIVVRRLNNNNHTWSIDLKKYLKNSLLISSNIFIKNKDIQNHIF